MLSKIKGQPIIVTREFRPTFATKYCNPTGSTELSNHRASVAIAPRRFLCQFLVHENDRHSNSRQPVVAAACAHPLGVGFRACPRPAGRRRSRTPLTTQGGKRKGVGRDAPRLATHLAPSLPPRGCAAKENTKVILAPCHWRLCIRSFVASPVSTFRFLLSPYSNGVGEVLLQVCEDVDEGDKASDNEDMSESSDDGDEPFGIAL